MESSSVAAYAAQRYGLQGMTALVTGGSKGIGAAIVEHYARLGARVRSA
jgi:Tropinone reductase 1